jgi:hypothetical protein
MCNKNGFALFMDKTGPGPVNRLIQAYRRAIPGRILAREFALIPTAYRQAHRHSGRQLAEP